MMDDNKVERGQVEGVMSPLWDEKELMYDNGMTGLIYLFILNEVALT